MVPVSLFRFFAATWALVINANGLVPQPRITDPPILVRRQDAASGFIGYVSTDGGWYPESCEPGSTVSESSSYFACKPTTASSFDIATTCSASSILLAPGATFPCGSNFCYTMYIFINIEDQSPHSAFACDSIARQISFYETTPTTSTTPLVGSTTSIPTQTLQITTNAPSSPSSSSNGISATSIPNKSKAWIAGPVIGGSVGLAIIAALSFWVWKLKSVQSVQQPIVYVEERKPPIVAEGYPGMSAHQLDSRAVRLAGPEMGRVELAAGSYGD